MMDVFVYMRPWTKEICADDDDSGRERVCVCDRSAENAEIV